MLLELAIGDAYGAGFEYADTKLILAHNDLSRYVQHPRHGILPGAYTDDTQMSLAIAEAIVSEQSWTAENLAKRFVEAFKRDPREGYASRFYDFLVGVKDGTQFLAEIRPDSDKSGAAMRAAPIGVYGSIDEVLEKAELQAAITHNTIDGINAAKAAALMSHYFIYKLGAKAELGKFIESRVAGEWATTWKGKVGAKGWMSVRAAITAVSRNQRMSDLLKDCINFSGDVDTVATIALAAASCSEEVEQDLPPVLIENLENGEFGRDYLKKLNQALMMQVKR
jgi:ADP-ribosyl-[dinitrogen reductase] hydrolase